MDNANTPYASLEPGLILDAIEQLGFPCSGRLLALNSFENRVYQIGIEEAEPLIVKFYRPQRWLDAAILEEHQFSTELLTHEIPVVAPLAVRDQTLHEFQGFRFAIFPRQGGRAFEVGNLECLEQIGRFIGRLHAVGACQTFQHRLRLDVQSYGYAPYKFLLEQNFIPLELQANFRNTVEGVLEKINEIFQQIGEVTYLRVHGDCHAGNILWNQAGPQIVDLDDCLLGPAVQDLWMLIAGGTAQETNVQLQKILRGYQEFHHFNFRELHLIEALRTLRMIHYAGWLAKRWEDPAFPLNFPWFNSFAYWQQQIQHLNEQKVLLDQLQGDTYLVTMD